MAHPVVLMGLDVGSSVARVAVASLDREHESLLLLGLGAAPMEGMQKGVVTDVEDAVRSVSAALDAAERMAGMPLERGYVSINGSHLSSQNSRGVIAVSRADGEITAEDVTRVINAAQAVSLPNNREIIHVLPQNYIVDGHEHISDPVGMTGVRLEVEAHMVEGSTPFIKNITKVVNQAGVHVEDFVFAPLAAAHAVLDKRQRELGVVLVDLGAGTSSLVVYEEMRLMHTAVLPLGSSHITNDVAIGLRTSIDAAEEIKRRYGTALPAAIKDSESIVVQSDDEHGSVSRKEVSNIIRARLDEIMTFVDRELKAIGRSGLLPAGVVFSGGGAQLPGVVEVAKAKLRLPARIGAVRAFESAVEQARDPSNAVVLGLILWARENERSSSRAFSLGIPDMRVTVGKVRHWLKSFLP